MLKSQCFTLLLLHRTPHTFQSFFVLLFQYPTVHPHSFHFFRFPLPPFLLYCFLHLNRNMRASNAIVLKIIAYIRQGIIGKPCPRLLHAPLLHGSLPPASAAPENPSVSLTFLLLAARIGEDHILKSNPVEWLYLLYIQYSIHQILCIGIL